MTYLVYDLDIQKERLDCLANEFCAWRQKDGWWTWSSATRIDRKIIFCGKNSKKAIEFLTGRLVL